MLRNVFWKTLRDQRRGLLWWGIGLVVLAVYLMWFYPSLRDQASTLNAYLEQLPPALRATFMGEFTDFTSPEGYLNTELYFFIVPFLFVIFAVGFGSNAIAGEEERGTLDLLLANPLPRWQVVVEKFATLVVSTAALAFVLCLGLLIGGRMVNLEISFGRVAEATASSVLLSLAFGTLALALGCASGQRGLSVGLATALAIAAYFLNSLAPLVEALKPYRKLSLFYYYIGADPLTKGLNLGHAAVLIGVTVVLLAVGMIAFERRDVAV